MNKQNLNSRRFSAISITRILLGIALFITSFHKTWGEESKHTGEMNAVIKQLLRSPAYPSDEEAIKVSRQLSTTLGQQVAIARLVDYLREHAANVDEINAVRRIGNGLGQDFAAAVLQAAVTTDNASSRARLLKALRNANPSLIPTLSSFLQDTRIADPTKKLGSDDLAPYRICDIAYNVISEIEAIKKSEAPKVYTAEDLKSRDASIKSLVDRLALPKNP